VEKAGDGVEVLATAGAPGEDGVPARIVAVRQGAVLATAFHPELTGDERVHRSFVDLVRQQG
jgi:5'-phosphate synthase pdxT subunit